MILGDEKAEAAAREKEAELGRDAFAGAARGLMLQTIDMYWMDHLEMMDYLRGSVNLRAYGQRDPLVEYKKDGLRLFKEMEGAITDTIRSAVAQVKAAMHVDVPLQGVEIHEGTIAPVQTTPKLSTSSPRTNDGEKVGRNDPCPCGAKKADGTPVKYKNCHGR